MREEVDSVYKEDEVNVAFCADETQTLLSLASQRGITMKHCMGIQWGQHARGAMWERSKLSLRSCWGAA